MDPLRKILDHLLVQTGFDHIVGPATFGNGPHDCALTSAYWAAPKLSEPNILEAFGYCTENWPFAGITNKEFAIALSYLKVSTTYCGKKGTLESLLKRRPKRCVALLRGHFIPILKGKLIAHDQHYLNRPHSTVYCYWIFH